MTFSTRILSIRCLCEFPHDPCNPFELSNFLRRTLRVTAGYQYAALGIASMNPTDNLPYFGIRSGRHRASIQYSHRTRFDSGGFLQSGPNEFLLQRGAVGLAGSTSKIENVKSPHNREEL